MGPCCRINEQNQSEGYYPAGVTSTTPLTRGVTRWYVYDGLGSVIGELDANNNLTTSRQYDVYGAPRAGTQQGVTATASQGYVGSLGHVTDQSTGGLIYMQARYYDPGIGRFVSEDPKEQGYNWFAYCHANPVNSVDESGCDDGSINAGALDFFAVLGTGFAAAAVLNRSESIAAAVRQAQLAIGCYAAALVYDHQIPDDFNAAIAIVSAVVAAYTPMIADYIAKSRGLEDSAPAQCTATIAVSLAYGMAVCGAIAAVDYS
jgi:RHS repeat-associated protein